MRKPRFWTNNLSKVVQLGNGRNNNSLLPAPRELRWRPPYDYGCRHFERWLKYQGDWFGHFLLQQGSRYHKALTSNSLEFIILYTYRPVSQMLALASGCLRNLVGYWGSLKVPRMNSYASEALNQCLWVSVPILQHSPSLDTALQCFPEFPNGIKIQFP